MFYKYRIKNCKKYFDCSLEKIIKVFYIYIDNIKCIKSDQNRGSIYKL